MKPYYSDEAVCECGCGEAVARGRRFVSGHNLRVLERTEEHCRNISEGQRRAWKEKRKRKPVGSTNKDVHGYVRVKVHRGAGRWRKQHRIVAEEFLGRPLESGEHVHHINGIRDDNRPENLYVCRSASHHNRVEATLPALLPEMLDRGIVIFDHKTGEYRLGD